MELQQINPGFMNGWWPAGPARAKEISALLPRKKLALFGSTLVLVGLIWAVFENSGDTGPLPYTEIIELNLPEQPLLQLPAAPGADGWESVAVKSGQTLDAIFRQQGLSIALLQRILNLNDNTRGLRRIRPGDVFEFRRDAVGDLAEMRFPLDEERYLVVSQAGSELHADTQARQMSFEVVETQGVITSSLFMAGKKAGLSDQMVMKLANIFG